MLMKKIYFFTRCMLAVAVSLLPAGSSAQCTVTMSASTSCGVPAVLRVESNFVPYRIEWKRDGNTIRNDSAVWSSTFTDAVARGIDDNAAGVWVDKDGSVYYGGARNGIVYKCTQGAAVGPVVAGGSRGAAANQLMIPTGLWKDQFDTLYVSDVSNHRILKYPPNATGSTVAGVVVAGPPAGSNPSGNALNRLNNAYDLSGDADRNIYVADFANHRILKFARGSVADGFGTVVAGVTGSSGPGTDRLNSPIGVHVDKNGYIFVADMSNQRILKFPPNATSGTSGTVVAGDNNAGLALNQFTRARYVFVDGYGNIYVVDDNVPSLNVRILMFPPNSTKATMGKVIASGSSLGFAGGGLFVSDSGHVFYGDWSNNRIIKNSAIAPKDTLTATQAGTYTATIYGFNGCVETRTLVVSASGGPSVTLGSNPSVCAGATSASLSYSNATGTPNQYSITWNSAAQTAGFTAVTNQTLPSGSVSLTVPSGATSGNTYNGTMTVRNSTTGCVSTTYNISVTITAGITATPGSSSSICAGGTSVLLSYTATGTPNQYSIAWNTAAQTAGFAVVTNQPLPSSPVSIAVPAAALPATYSGTLTMRNSTSGCVSAASNISVVVHALPLATATPIGPLAVCTGQTETLTAGAGVGYTYQWKDAQGVVGNNGTFDVGTTGNYYVVVTDGNNCKDSSATISVTQVALPQGRITPGDTSFCVGGFVRLEVATADTGLSYQWKDGSNLLQATADFLEVNTTGIYSAVLTRNSVAGCKDSTQTVEVTVHPLPRPPVNWDGTILTTGTEYDTYQWHIGGQPIVAATGDSYRPDTVGSYSVSVTDSNGCSNTSAPYQVNEIVGVSGKMSAEMIAVYPNPAKQQVHINGPSGIYVVLSSVDGKALLHRDGAGSIDLSMLPEGVYLIRITNAAGLLLKNERLVKTVR